MQKISSDPKVEMRALIGLASRIARRGYGEPVIELALGRKGVSREVARLVAVSVVSCHAAILAAERHARLDVIAGIGGGAFLGWSLGFNRGIEDGFDWMVRAIERLTAG